LSYRQLEEMIQEQGVAVDHSMINRWVLKYPQSWKGNADGGRGRRVTAGGWMRRTLT
jgi:transposase-like protein